jgi:hypothetical protein
MKMHMLQIKKWLSCAIVVFAIQDAACGGRLNSSKAYEVDPGRCSVRDFDRALEESLCAADGAIFSNRIRSLWESPDIAERKRAVEILERVWRLDPKLGDGLPLQALDREDFRAAVVEFLAQAVRGGLSDVALWDLQKFAIQFARLHRDDDRTAAAVRIIGYTDASSQLQFMTETIQAGPGSVRSTAILALGDMCSAEATAFLISMEKDMANYSDAERRLASSALKHRSQGPLAYWCKGKEPSTRL